MQDVENHAAVFAIQTSHGGPYNSSDAAYFWRFLIWDASKSNEPISATACGTWLCMEAYNISVTNGVLSQKTVAQWNTSSLDSRNETWISMTGMPNNIFNLAAGVDYGIPVTVWQALIGRLTTSDSVNYYSGPGGASELIYSSDFATNLFNVTDYNAWMAQFTLSLTNQFRTAGNVTGDTTQYAGTAYSSQTYVRIRWLWLVFPGVLVVASVGLLVATVCQTRRRGVKHWKDSALALLHCRIEQDVWDRAEESEDLKLERVRLFVDGGGAVMRKES